MRKFFHKELAEGKWFQLSLIEQLSNIGSEVSRTNKWQNKNQKLFQNASERALELFDLTLEDPRWRGRLREIARMREIFCDAILGAKNYQSSIKDIEKYFLPFTYLSKHLKN